MRKLVLVGALIGVTGVLLMNSPSFAEDAMSFQLLNLIVSIAVLVGAALNAAGIVGALLAIIGK